MQEPAPIHPTSHVGVSSEEAARILGVSLTTIRRWIREGRLEAERVSRPQGYVLQIMVSKSAVEAAVSTTAADDHAPRRLHVSTTAAAPAAPTTTAADDEPRLDVADTTHQVREVGVREAFHLIERQQQTIMELSGRVGYLQAELANARDTIRALQAPAKDPDVGLTEASEAGNVGVEVEESTTAETAVSPTRRWWHRLLWG